MLDTREKLLSNITFPPLTRLAIETLQVNLGYLCNQQCQHCHVNAGPNRKEIMSQDTIDEILEFLRNNPVTTLDLTGGAPEMNPGFRRLIKEASQYVDRIIDRCNLTILLEDGYTDLVDLLVEHQVEIIASLPCYTEENVNSQRGKGVFERSILAIKKLNAAGYGKENTGLHLNLVYNPAGAFLPPPQQQLEDDYRVKLSNEHGVVFNHLYTITNMPINRFGSTLLSKGHFDDYLNLLKESFNPGSLNNLMCLTMISVDHEGNLYDCDFNQMLGLGMRDKNNRPLNIRDISKSALPENIIIGEHCYACSAGQGSSCGGALT